MFSNDILENKKYNTNSILAPLLSCDLFQNETTLDAQYEINLSKLSIHLMIS